MRITSAISASTAHGSARNEKKTAVKATPFDIHQYLAFCWQKKLNAASVARRVFVLREFYKLLQRDGVLKRNPMVTVRAPKQWKRVPKASSETEVTQLLDLWGFVANSYPL